jgi:hypothetical protein
MHRLIMGEPRGRVVDHRDGDPMNALRSNLRVCSGAQNSMNRKINSNNRIGYKGVRWLKTHNRWAAAIRASGHRYFLGYFDSPELAAQAYDAAALKYHGEFARLNEVKPCASEGTAA